MVLTRYWVRVKGHAMTLRLGASVKRGYYNTSEHIARNLIFTHAPQQINGAFKTPFNFVW